MKSGPSSARGHAARKGQVGRVKGLRAALFFRVSTEEQTTENQRPEVERLAAARALDVVAVYEETVSGAKENRTKLAAMLDAAHRGAFEVVLVWALDRLGRNMFETIETVRKLDRSGVQLLSVREPWLDTAGPARSLLLSIFAWVAEQERERLIERTRAGLDRARRAGKVLGRPRKAFRMTTAQALRKDGLSYRAIAERLDVPVSTLQRAMSQKGAPGKRSATR